MNTQNLSSIFAVLLIGSMLSGAAHSQTQSNIPSDNDLFAGYCLGIVVAKEKDLKSVPNPGADFVQSIHRDKQRFLGYIIGQNLTDYSGILIAIENGENDFEANRNALNTKCPLNLPSDDEVRSNGENWYKSQIQLRLTAVKKCMESLPSFKRAERCNDPTKLPF